MSSFIPKVHEEKGGNQLTVESGGKIAVKPGGGIVIEQGANLSLATLVSALIQHYQVAPVAISPTYVHAAINLGAAAQDITLNITNPDVPRTLTAKGNVSGITGNVVLTATNILDASITDTIALNGATEVEGIKAAKTLVNIHLPAQTHTPTAQVETATAAGSITGNGNAAVIVTAAGMTGSPKTFNVAVLNGDTASQWAAKVRTALAADAAVTALFAVGGSGASITLTALAPAANDGTLNISLDNGTCTGITTAASSANTTAGVPYDTVSIGIGQKFGLPHVVAYAAMLLVKLFNGSSDAGSLAVNAAIEQNLYTLSGTPDGVKLLDLYYMV